MTKTQVLSKADILGASDIKVEQVEAWGGVLYVKGMTGAERDQFEASIIQWRGKEQSLNMANIRAKLCVMTICNEIGERLFDDSDMRALSAKSAAELQKVFIVAQRLSGLTDSDVEELAKGLEQDPFAGSPSV